MFKSYFSEKGKNLATKEDIGLITQKVEEIKNEFDTSRIKYKVEYESLHAKRSEVIENIYGKLSN